MSNKVINNDDYDLILEEKEKELKKEKRNKIILGSSLALLLLLGSTAVAVPIISVAVNNKNNLEIKIPDTLTFTNVDITKLIDGYKSEIQTRKLSFNEFQNDLVNITKKYIAASNVSIGLLVVNSTISEDKTNNVFNISIKFKNEDYRVYQEDGQLDYNTVIDNENKTLSITIANDNSIFEFFNPINLDSIDLSDLKNLVQKEIDDQKLSNYINTDLEKLKNFFQNLLGTDQFELIISEETNLIIKPIHPNKFESSNSEFIVDGNIVISDLNFFTLIEFGKLQQLWNILNNMILNNNKPYYPEDFQEYIKQNIDQIKQIIYDNLESSNKFNINDILYININDNNELVIELNDNYLKYKLIEENKNFEIIDNKLIIRNLDFLDPISPLSWFTYENYNGGYKITGLSNEGKKQSRFKFPESVRSFERGAFQHCTNIVRVNMSLITKCDGLINSAGIANNYDNAIPAQVFMGCTNLSKVILPNKNIEHLGTELFKGCTSLKTIEIPSNFREFHESVFRNSGLESITIPNTLVNIWNYVFYGCSSLKWMQVSTQILKSILFGLGTRNFDLYVPSESLKQYYRNQNIYQISNIIVGKPPKN